MPTRGSTDPTRMFITKSQDDYKKIKPIINASLTNNQLWVIATTYEWGVSQLGIKTPHANAIFIEYDQFDFQPLTYSEKSTMPLPKIKLAPQWTNQQFQVAVNQAKAAIKEGDIYQINLSYPSQIIGNASIESIYDAIFKHQTPPHGAFINTDFCKIASCSPEEFFILKMEKLEQDPLKEPSVVIQIRLKTNKHLNS